MRPYTSLRRLAAILAATALFIFASTLVSTEAFAAKKPPSGTQATCPSISAMATFVVAPNVAAGFENDGNISTYWFASLQNEDPFAGVPGLVKYCVYPTPTARPTLDVQAVGSDGTDWIGVVGPRGFSFARPGGNSSNIPLDGNTTVMGTATWSIGDVPESQTILLHISDQAMCAQLYGSQSPDTCFVIPSESACILDKGDTDVAYNAIPFTAGPCATYSLGFEATETVEFGNAVVLAGTARDLVSLKVLFSSWACEDGRWYDFDCVTAPGATFTHPITANIYAVDDCSGTPCAGPLIVSVTQSPPIPYRPSDDSVLCPAGGWFNSVAGECKPQISTVLTFDFPTGITLPNEVFWSVAFNTTHYGNPPIGESATCFGSSGGCPYDSLNVGAETFPNAPYVGTDVDVIGSWFWNGVFYPGFAPDNEPVGEIVTQ